MVLNLLFYQLLLVALVLLCLIIHARWPNASSPSFQPLHKPVLYNNFVSPLCKSFLVFIHTNALAPPRWTSAL